MQEIELCSSLIVHEQCFEIWRGFGVWGGCLFDLLGLMAYCLEIGELLAQAVQDACKLLFDLTDLVLPVWQLCLFFTQNLSQLSILSADLVYSLLYQINQKRFMDGLGWLIITPICTVPWLLCSELRYFLHTWLAWLDNCSHVIHIS